MILNNKIKNMTFYILFGVSSIFSMMLFVNLVQTPAQKILLGIFALGFEFLKIFTFIYSKMYWRHGRKLLWGFFFFIYFSMAVISSIASTGFSISSIKSKSSIFGTEYEKKKIYNERLNLINKKLKKFGKYDSYELNRIINKIAIYEKEYKAYKKIWAVTTNTNTYRIYKKKYNESHWQYYVWNKKYKKIMTGTDPKIIELQKQKRKIQSEMIKISKKTRNDVGDVFTQLGSIIGLSAEKFMSLLFILFTVFLEVGIAVTSVNVTDNDDAKHEIVANNSDKEMILRYIHELFNTKSKRLSTNKKISNETGISIKKCEEIKDFLNTWKINGNPLIKIQRGGTFSDFSKEKILSIINDIFKYTDD